MTYAHGISVIERPTSIATPTESMSGIPFVVGTAPVHLTDSPKVNKPVLAYSFEDAATALGYSDDWEKYTLCEFMYSQFKLYGRAPVIFVNVYNPDIHVNVTDVDVNDVIGGIDENGKASGLGLINQILPQFSLLPDLILAPGWSGFKPVADAMVQYASDINGHFKAMTITDLSSSITKISDAQAWKNSNGYNSKYQLVTFPQVTKDGRTYHLSTHLAGVIAQTDDNAGGLPYLSPSNKSLQIDGTWLDAEEVFLGLDQASGLNTAGIITAVNFGVNGWRSWGNQTGNFPDGNDPKDIFISVRRMFNFVPNQIILSYSAKVDDAINKNLIETVTDSLNIWLNSLVATGALVGGRLEFTSADNTESNLMMGKIVFRLYMTPPSQAQEIQIVVEYDASYLTNLIV